MRWPRRNGEERTGAVQADLASACWAPSSSLYFQPDGVVKACCATHYEIAHYQGALGPTLSEQLAAGRSLDQRAALANGDFSLGCQECGAFVERAQRENSLAKTFDAYASGDTSIFPRYIDFALSNRCNLECVMCNGDLSSSIRMHRERRPPLPAVYDDAFFEQLRPLLMHIERASFKGGEPFLSREVQRVWDLLIDMGKRPDVSLYTNGTIWNDRVERYVRELSMNIRVSVDAVDPHVFESIRVGADAASVWGNVERFRRVTDEVGSSTSLSFCLMTSNWRQLMPMLLEATRRSLSCRVVLVNQPVEYSLCDLPPDELSLIVDELSEIEAGGLEELGDLRVIWDHQLRTLRQHLETPVEVRAANSIDYIYASPVDEAGVVAELLEWSGEAPLQVRLSKGTVMSVGATVGTAWLMPDAWVGAPSDAIGGVLEAHGVSLRFEPSLRPDGGREFRATARREGGDASVRVVVLPPGDADARSIQNIYVACRAPA